MNDIDPSLTRLEARALDEADQLRDEVEQLRTRLADRNASLDRVIAERDELTAELTKAESKLQDARYTVDQVLAKKDAVEVALTESRTNAARLANENGALVAENARVRQQRDAALAADGNALTADEARTAAQFLDAYIRLCGHRLPAGHAVRSVAAKLAKTTEAVTA